MPDYELYIYKLAWFIENIIEFSLWSLLTISACFIWYLLLKIVGYFIDKRFKIL